MRTLEEREQRLARARAASRIEIGLGTVVIAIPPLIYLAVPTTFEAGFGPARPDTSLLVGFIWLVMLFGYVWMLRIRFTGPEDGARSNWRSH